MKKRTLSLLMCLLLIVGMLPTTAFAAGGATDTWAVKLNVSESDAYTYNGQKVLALGFGVQSDNMTVRKAASMVLAVDLEMFDLLKDNDDFSGVENAAGDLTVSLVQASTPIKKGVTIKPSESWNLNVYYAKSSDEKFGYIQMIASQDAVDDKVVTAKDLATMYIGFKSGKSVSDLTKNSIRFINAAECALLNQGSAIEITDGKGNMQQAFLKNGSAGTLTITPEVVANGFTFAEPAKPALGGNVTIDKTTPKFGDKLTADTSALDYGTESKGELTYQWYRGGEKITGATGAEYTTVAADMNKPIKVEVKNSNNSSSVTSAPTAAVAKANYTGSAAVSPTGIKPTHNSVSFTGTTGQEYACTLSSVTTAPDTDWAPVSKFDDLDPNTQYNLWYRIAATDTVNPSAALKATFTTLSAPITSVDASVTAPAVGQPLDTTGTVASGASYSISAVEWYEGTDATGTAATGNAKPDRVYTAKITLTADSGESFAEGVTLPTGYTKVSADATTIVLLTKPFPKTGSLPAATVTAPTGKTGLEYNGSKQALLSSVATASGGTVQYSLDNSTWNTAIPMGTDAKTYTVYYMAKGDGSHSDSAVASISVTIASKEISGVTIGSIADQPYTDGAITPDPEVKDGGTTLTKDKDYTVSCSHTYVGTNTGTFTITGKGNYTGTKSADFNIVAADQTPTFTTPKDLAKGGAKLDLTPLVQNAKGNVTFTIASGTAANLEMGNTLVSTGITGVVKINVSITAKDVDGDGNNEYNAFYKSEAITVNVIDKTASVYTTKPAAKTDLKYDGSEQELVTKGTANGGTVKYSLGSSPWSTEIPTAKDAGDYTVQYMIEGDATYTGSPAETLMVTIGQKEVTVSGITAENKAYDGGTDATVDASGATFDGIVSGDTLTITATGTFANADVANDKTVNLSLGALSGASVGNYKLAASGHQTTTTADITPRDLIVTPNPGQSKKFGTEDPTLHSTNSGRVTGQIPDFSGALSRVEGKDVGQYDITLGTLALIDHFSSGFKASNYTLKMVSPAVKFEITQADAPALENITLSQKYNVTTEQSKDIGTAGMPTDAGTLTYTEGTPVQTTGSVTIDSASLDATGKVTYKLSGGKAGDTVTLPVIIGSTNYADATVNVVITLTKPSSSGGSSSSAITVEKAENGTVSADRKSASKGKTVTLTVKPDDGYELASLKALDNSGKELTLTEKDGTYTFTMPAGRVTVKAAFAETEFVMYDDVKMGDYFYEAVKWAVKKDITNGIGNNLFGPDQPCTRGQIVTFLWRAAGSPEAKAMSSFSDVADSAYYAKAVAWAVENGITSGTGEGKFSPDATCTRAQIVTFLWRANGSPIVSGNSVFSDVAADAYYAAAVKWAEKNGITSGIGGGLFGSDNDCTRAQIVTFLYRSVK